MATNFPGSLDTTTQLPNNRADATVTATNHAQDHDNLADAVIAIEAELGALPKGPYAATVGNRFEIMSYKGQSVKSATIQALPAVTYANGTAGVGATLTATGNGVMAAIDGVTPVVGDRMLVKNQAAPLQNGIYVVTSIGAVGAPFILTRHYDGDTSAKIADSKLLVDQGTVNSDTEWYQASTAPTMGTTALYFRRTQPIYGSGNPRSLWIPGSTWPTGTQPIMETIPRQMMTGGLILTAFQTFVGGIVIPAGRAITNVNMIYTTAGTTVTGRHYGIVRQSDRVVLAHTANVAAAPSTNVVTTTALTAPFTPIEDTPVWIVVSSIAATHPSLGCAVAGTAALNLLAPAVCGVNVTATSTTALTDGAVLTVATTGVANIFYLWLT